MKHIKVEILALVLIIAFIGIAKIKVYFAYYNYTYITATVADNNWKGAPYVVKEVNFQNRCFEIGDIVNGTYKFKGDEILNKYNFFSTTLNIGNEKYHSDGNLLDLCIELNNEQIDIVSDGLFTKELELKYLIDVQWSPRKDINHVNEVDDYYVTYSSKLSLAGFTSLEYEKQKIREFVIRKIMDAILEYSRYDELNKIMY
ncbi:MAG: hypothetical protein V3V00_15550 [Saprospiraceae bacterium]